MTQERWYGLLVLIVLCILLPVWIPFVSAAFVAVVASACTYWIASPDDDQWNEDQL